MNDIYIDIDQDFETFLTSKTWGFVKKNLPEIEKKYGDFLLFKRKSSSGHVHLRLDFPDKIDLLDTFIIRSLCHDDIYRIGIDLRRLHYQGENEINRLFDMKFKNGKKYESGPWILVDIYD